MDTLGNIPGITLLGHDDELLHISCRYVMNGFVAQGDKHVSFHTPHRGVRVSKRLADLPAISPLTDDILKAIFRFTLPSFGFLLLRLSLGFALCHRIAPRCEDLPGGEVDFTGLTQAHERILT